MEAMTTDTANADIRAVFFDIDGTLTSFTTHTVPDSTIEAIHRLQAAGVKVLICTGRAPSQMHVVLDTMPVTFDGVVAFNGQYCFDDTGFFASQALDTADIEVILDWLDRHPDVVCNFGEKDYVYFNQSNDLLRATWSKLGKTAPTRYFEDPRTRALDHETFQISPFVGPELEAELVGLCSNVRGVRWHPDFTDLIPADGGKPRGIQRFMAHYGITREQTMPSAMAAMTRICSPTPASGSRWAMRPPSPRPPPTTSLTMWTTTVCAMPCCISGCYAIKTSQQFALFCPAVTGLMNKQRARDESRALWC